MLDTDAILDYLRYALYGALIILTVFFYQAWQKEHPTVSPQTPQTVTVPGHYVPDSTPAAATATQTNAQAATTTPAPVEAPAGQLIRVKTDLVDLTIDTRGGDIIDSKLLSYKESLGSAIPFQLFTNDPHKRYIAESGLLSKIGPDSKDGQALYSTTQTSFELAPGQNELTVPLTWEKDGIKVTKLFTLVRGSYEVKVKYEIDNQSRQAWEGNFYTQLLRTNTPPPNVGGMFNLATYFGAAISTPEKPFDKITFKQMQEKNISAQVQDGWAAMIQHYFITAWVPPASAVSTYYSRVTPDGLYTIGMIGDPLTVLPGTKVATEAKLYMGPAIANQLEKTAPHLKLTIDYGWFWFISGIIFWALQHIYDVIGNWGWSIVFVTIIIKLLFYKLSAKSYRSMSMLKKMQPRVEKLKERYGDDKQKLTQATMDLYRQEKVNPMSGCLPMLVQIPVFIALYWVLVESVQLRQAPFMLWIHDLSQKDPYYVLPLLMGLSMFIQQRLNPPPPDPTQAKVMMMMPAIFTVMFLNFPAGLMLYWFVNNTLSFIQQWYIMRTIK